jgi:hypothetical protein
MNATEKRQLLKYYLRNGCCRFPDHSQRRTHSRTYKKGYEVRLSAFTQRELSQIRRLLRAAKLPLGSPFRKVNRWIQPVYGKEATERFARMFKVRRNPNK